MCVERSIDDALAAQAVGFMSQEGVYMCVCMCVCAYVCVRVHAWVCVCVCVCLRPCVRPFLSNMH